MTTGQDMIRAAVASVQPLANADPSGVSSLGLFVSSVRTMIPDASCEHSGRTVRRKSCLSFASHCWSFLLCGDFILLSSQAWTAGDKREEREVGCALMGFVCSLFLLRVTWFSHPTSND